MIVAVAWVKNEVDIIDATIRNMRRQVDRIIVADQMSTDGTRDILAEHDITVIDDTEPGFHQSRIMTALTQRAFDEGAEFVVPFDGDEMWLGLDTWGRRPGVFSVPVFDHVPTVEDPDVADPVVRQEWRHRESRSRKVVLSKQPEPETLIGFGNHRVVGRKSVHLDEVTIRHFPNRSVEQFVAKVDRGYESMRNADRGVSYGSHWKAMQPNAAQIFEEVFQRRSPATDPQLVHDPFPRPCRVST